MTLANDADGNRVAPNSNSSHGFMEGRISLVLPEADVTTHRILLAVATLGLFGPALIAWSSIVQLPLVGLFTTLACVVTLALVVTIFSTGSAKVLQRLDYVVLALAVFLLVAWAITELYFYPAYGTDEAAFVQYAAQLLLHGHNPYTHNLISALTQYRVPIQYATYKLNGTVASTLGYPALSFLLVAPVVAITGGVQSIIIENVLFLAIELILVFAFLPKAYRALGVVLVLGLPFLFDYTIGGDIVTMAIPFLLVAAFHWTETGKGGALGRAGTARAVSLGLAASISQFAWFVAPFLVLGIWLLRRNDLGRRRGSVLASQFTLIAAASFLVVNLPFIAWGPKAWLSGVLGPLDQHAIPFGQGFIDLSVFFRIGGGNLFYFTIAAVLVYLSLITAFSVFFTRLWRAAFVIPSAAFLLSTRSLSEYFIMMVSMWVVSAFSPGPGLSQQGSITASNAVSTAPSRRDVRTHRLLLAAVVGTPVLAVIVALSLALTAPAPLRIRFQSVETNGQFRSIWRIRATVTNVSLDRLEPHFATDASGYMTTFWNVIRGPRILSPGEKATYTLVAPNVGSMPGVTQSFVLQAVTATPESISSSTLFTPEQFDCTISPSYVDHVVPFGHHVKLRVELRSPYGAPVDRQGVRIALSQIIYAQDALIPGEARINGAPEGQSPVYAKTNSRGRATFELSDSSPQGGNPLYFQAFVNPVRGFPYGYSEVVSVQWTKSTPPRS